MRIDQLNAERAAIVTRLEELKYSGSGLDGSRRMVDDYEERLGLAAAECDKERVQYERLAKTLVAMKVSPRPHPAGSVCRLQVDGAGEDWSLSPPPPTAPLSQKHRSLMMIGTMLRLLRRRCAPGGIGTAWPALRRFGAAGWHRAPV